MWDDIIKSDKSNEDWDIDEADETKEIETEYSGEIPDLDPIDDIEELREII
jgi:hypothetical protein